MIRCFRERENGFVGIGMLLAFMVIISAFVLICEYYRAFSIRKSIVVELERALNASVEMSVMDEYRKDRISRLDRDVANEAFYDFLTHDLTLTLNADGTLSSGLPGSGGYYVLDIRELFIEQEPPRMRVRGDIVVGSGLLGGVISDTFRLPVSGNSHNLRID